MVALSVALTAGAATAQQPSSPVSLDPSVAAQGTTLVLTADESLLSPGGRQADSLTIALARGMRLDTTSREQLCAHPAAGTCPETSRIGFGRFSLAVRDFSFGGGDSELAWSIDAFLGRPLRRGDAASVVLVGSLLGAESVNEFLTPSLGTSVPTGFANVGRIVRGPGIVFAFPKLPVKLEVAKPATATASRLDLTLGAVRHIRQNFVRRIKVRTPAGYEVRKIRDHRLVSRYLLRAPRTCKRSWRAELRVGLPGGVRRTAREIACTKTLPGV